MIRMTLLRFACSLKGKLEVCQRKNISSILFRISKNISKIPTVSFEITIKGKKILRNLEIILRYTFYFYYLQLNNYAYVA